MSENRRRYGKPEIRLYYQKDDGSKVRIPYTPVRFSYLDSEKNDSRCTVLIRDSNYYLPDMVYFQSQAKWMIVWGYENTEQLQSRTVYVRDLRPRYSENGFEFEIVLFPKASFLRDNHSNQVIDETDILQVAGEVAKNNGLRLIVDVENFDEDLIAENEDINYKTYDIEDSNGNKRQVRVKIEQTVPEAGLSKMDTLKYLGARAKDGPLIVTMKDDSLVLKQRNFKRQPIAFYEYDGGNNELIKFYPKENNLLHEAKTRKIEDISDDPDSGLNILSSWQNRLATVLPYSNQNYDIPSIFPTGTPTVYSDGFVKENEAIQESIKANLSTAVLALRKKGYRISLGDGVETDPYIDGYYNIPGIKSEYEQLYKYVKKVIKKDNTGKDVSPSDLEKLDQLEEKLKEIGASFEDGEVTIPYLSPLNAGYLRELDDLSDEEIIAYQDSYKNRLTSEPTFIIALVAINPNSEFITEALSQYPEYELPAEDVTFNVNNFVLSKIEEPIQVDEQVWKGYTRMLPPEMDLHTGLYREARENTATSFVVPMYITNLAPEDIYTKDNIINQAEIDKNESDAEVLGNPYLHSGRLINIAGVAKKYSGPWYLLECEHVIDDSGYITKLTISRNTQNKVDDVTDTADIDPEQQNGNYQIVEITEGPNKGFKKLIITDGTLDGVISDGASFFSSDTLITQTLEPGEYLIEKERK